MYEAARMSSGKFLWRYDKVANGTANIPTAIVKDDLIFCSTGYGAGGNITPLATSYSEGGLPCMK